MGSEMCIRDSIWRPDCHLIVTGYQSHGTMGRKLIDGAKKVRLWGQSIKVRAKVHTIGGLSAHTDQKGLMDWYGNFKNRPPVFLVHGEAKTMEQLRKKLKKDLSAPAHIARSGEIIDLENIEQYQ